MFESIDKKVCDATGLNMFIRVAAKNLPRMSDLNTGENPGLSVHTSSAFPWDTGLAPTEPANHGFHVVHARWSFSFDVYPHYARRWLIRCARSRTVPTSANTDRSAIGLCPSYVRTMARCQEGPVTCHYRTSVTCSSILFNYFKKK